MHRVKETGTCICFIALKLLLLRLLSPDGGIGRRAGLKHLWETVPVRLRLRVQKPLLNGRGFFCFKYFHSISISNKYSNGQVDYSKIQFKDFFIERIEQVVNLNLEVKLINEKIVKAYKKNLI